jgi:hypothetical protein
MVGRPQALKYDGFFKALVQLVNWRVDLTALSVKHLFYLKKNFWQTMVMHLTYLVDIFSNMNEVNLSLQTDNFLFPVIKFKCSKEN